MEPEQEGVKGEGGQDPLNLRGLGLELEPNPKLEQEATACFCFLRFCACLLQEECCMAPIPFASRCCRFSL